MRVIILQSLRSWQTEHECQAAAGGAVGSCIRDESGRREVLAHGSEYVVVECCNDQQALKAIRRRIQGQMNGLDVSARKVQGRIHVLDRFLARFRRAG